MKQASLFARRLRTQSCPPRCKIKQHSFRQKMACQSIRLWTGQALRIWEKLCDNTRNGDIWVSSFFSWPQLFCNNLFTVYE